MVEQRVVVIGAGVLGLFTAWELVRAGGASVTVLDAAHPGDGSSGRSVGMVETQYLSKPEIEVRAFGLDTYAALERDLGLSFVHGGYLRLGRDESDAASFEDSIRLQKEFGVNDAILLSRNEMAARWPQLVTDDLMAGMLGMSDGYVDGYEVCQLLTSLIREGGGTVTTGTRLIAADLGPNDVWALTTSRTTIEADMVVNAAGPWAGVVGDLLGGPVDLLPQLSGAVTIKLESPISQTPFVMDYVPNSGDQGFWFRSESTVQLIAGLHSDEPEFDPVSPDIALGSMSMDVIEVVAMMLAGRLRGADDMQVAGSWTGIYPTSPDYNPIVGVHPSTPALVCALGAGGAGIQLAPAVGRLAADAILGRTQSSFGADLQWSPNRWSGRS